MNIRKLELKDAPLMLEWMHDDSVIRDLRTNFMTKTIDDCIGFINAAQDESESLHLAIVDDNDKYMGTVSLKHINNGTAEFGITVRKCAMGKGFSHYGMVEILKIGFENRKVDMIYWCVDPVNHRAVRFYDKNGYKRCDAPKQASHYTKDEKEKFMWYCIINKKTPTSQISSLILPT